MTRIYNLYHRLERDFPSLIFEIDYSKMSKIGKLIVRNRNKLQDKISFEIHNFSPKPITAFSVESGQKVNLLKEIKKFDAYVKMSRNIDIILNI